MVAARSTADTAHSSGRVGTFVASVAAAWLGLSAAPGCASASKNNAPQVNPAMLAREADAELERGCYRCLLASAEKYEAAIAAGAESLDLAAAGAWALAAVRERELGLQPSDAMERARSHQLKPSSAKEEMTVKGRAGGPAPSPVPSEVIEAYIRIVSSLPLLNEGVSKEAQEAASRVARELTNGTSMEAVRSRPAREGMLAPPERPEPRAVAVLRQRAALGHDPAASYLIQSLACSWLQRTAYLGPPAKEAGTTDGGEPPTGLMAFRSATCAREADPARAADALNRLAEMDPRFHEAHYFLGHLRLGEMKLVSAEREFLAAASGLPGMTAAWAMLGATRLSMEEYEWAAADLARALEIEPNQREAMLAQARALNYAGRFEEALAPTRRLLELGAWYVSDANYWLAFSELQLGSLQDADIHAREAKRTNPMNGDTARLSGLVAHRLAEFERARHEFDLAVSRNASDCESHLHLGMIHGQLERFEASVGAFVRARDCYAVVADSASVRRNEIDASSLPEPRKEIARARLAQRVAGYRRAQAGASLGAAEGETQGGAYDKALAHLDGAAVEPDLSARVGELRTRIAALRARR
ncbi:MAG: hypothetical protein JJE39_00255 [Vicinamibacteria bacterium]|nr:hypothetical protein [Vicinamibacteria bacterium]